MRAVPKSSAKMTIKRGNNDPYDMPAMATPPRSGTRPGAHSKPCAKPMSMHETTKHHGRGQCLRTMMSDSGPHIKRPKPWQQANVATAVAAETLGPLLDSVIAPRFVVSNKPPLCKENNVNHTRYASIRRSICEGPPSHGDRPGGTAAPGAPLSPTSDAVARSSTTTSSASPSPARDSARRSPLNNLPRPGRSNKAGDANNAQITKNSMSRVLPETNSPIKAEPPTTTMRPTVTTVKKRTRLFSGMHNPSPPATSGEASACAGTRKSGTKGIAPSEHAAARNQQ
mmetsp:Transcript_93875/g.270477  ORF Transcript_93875/g.270477 Transcript_93875/m.270477 type:complete len:284 (-) Transcript_93875:559-1410(-)